MDAGGLTERERVGRTGAARYSGLYMLVYEARLWTKLGGTAGDTLVP